MESESGTLSDTQKEEDGAEATSSPIVTVEGLRMVFDETVALDGISFTIDEGQIFGFIGPNGAGKTTTIKILSTLLEPNAGVATIDGLDVFEQPHEVRRIIGYMPDEFGVYEGITVWEYLDFFAGAFRIPRRQSRAVIDGVLQLTDLEELRGRMVSSLSKGMKQRLCLAKTLIHDPKVLILDEPASAMDPRARIEMRALLKELREMGKTVLISSHILTELSDVCDSVGIIEKGKILEWGTVEKITNKLQPSRHVHVTFHREFPEASEILAAHPQVREVAGNGREIRFEYLGDPERFHTVVKLLIEREAPIVTIGREATDLERVFLEVTRGELQ